MRSASKPIFISHAAADKNIADTVVDLLNTAMQINVQDAVFCTSLEGLKIPPGKDFKDFIKEQIQEPQIVVLLISQNYLASQFCLAELGASWAMSHRIIPFLIPPVTFDDMKAVLTGVHALRIQDAGDWNEAFAVFREVLRIDPNVNRWELKRDEHLQTLAANIKNQKPPPIVSMAKFEALKKKANAANAEIRELEKRNSELLELNERLKKAKDAKEVARIELDSLPAAKKFQRLIGEAKKQLAPLPNTVGEALYYHFRHQPLKWGGFGEDDKNADIQRALENGLLESLGEEGVKANTAHPKISRAIEALNRLESFVDRESEELVQGYEEEHDEELSFTSRYFWQTHLL
jgi:TIR domain